MASDISEVSDVEELIRQTGMDSSGTVEKIVDYFKSKRVKVQSRGRLYDGSDNSINFRLDNLQPVQLPQTNSNVPAELSPVHSSNATEAAGVAPLAGLSVGANRLPSFVSPGVATATSPVHIPRSSRTNVITSPTGRNTVHVSPRISNPNPLSVRTNLQKELLLQQYKRKNQVKCEAIRNVLQPASSTPIAGECSERRGNNLLDIRETISPINDGQEYATPPRVLWSPNAEREGIIAGRPVTSARPINTPVPATQDVADGVDQNFRENTPPRDENHVLVVPETPSPVRRSPGVPSTPLSGLSLQRHPPLRAASLAKTVSLQARPIESDMHNSSTTPSYRSILKNSEKSFSSVKNRVSFSDKLFAIRSLTPVASSDESQITSDESEEQETEQGEPRKKKLSPNRMQRSNGVRNLQRSRFMLDMARNQQTWDHARSPDKLVKNTKNKDNPSIELASHRDERNVQQSRRFFGNNRSNAIDYIEDPSPDAVKRRNNRNRTNSNVVNMIMDDWNERMEVDDPNDHRNPQLANQTIDKSLAITNIDTPRTVIMDIFDPPSAFCDDTQQGDHDASTNVEQLGSDAPGLNRSDPSRKRKQDCVSRRGSIDEGESDVAMNPKNSMLPNCIAPAERIVSVNSPHDHVPLNMIEVVDMIHTRTNSEMMASESENDRRTTINMPTKRRHTKVKVDTDTEKYLCSVKAARSQDKAKSKPHKNRRKLFAQEPSQGKDCDEPQPLPITPDVADTPEHEKQNGYVTKPLSVVVRRLSATTLSMATKSTQSPHCAEMANDIDAQSDVCKAVSDEPVRSPVNEKQNEEQNEKGDRPKIAHGKTTAAEVQKTAKQKSAKHHERKNHKKRTHQKNGRDESYFMMDKYLKNMSNEIRHQIESEGPRRSHRNRRLAAEVLRNNPDISCHAAPQYVMPTINDVLKYCQISTKTTTGGNAKTNTKSSNTDNMKKDMKSQRVVPPTTSSEERKVLETKRGRGRPKKIVTQKDKFDSDGFRIPPVPSDEIQKPSPKAAYKPTDHSTEASCSSSSGFPRCVSIDSGLSSAVMMSDDAAESPQPEQPTTSKSSSKSKQNTAEHSESSCASASPSTSEIMAEKRKTLDWMMMLMENRKNRPVAIPMVEVQGFTHLSLEHLTFEERDGIEYSFYVYSNGDNFGFLRFPPKSEKKSTRTKRCSLKFLILSGSLKFIINESTVNAVGGDFLMIPAGTSYRLVNGSETTLTFMVKTSASIDTNCDASKIMRKQTDGFKN